MLDTLEKQVETIPKRALTGDELKREEAYTLAEEIDSSLTNMSDSLVDTIRTLNMSTDRQFDPTNPFSAVLKILNVHMNSLQWIENNASEVENLLESTNAEVRTSQETERGRANARRVAAASLTSSGVGMGRRF